MAAMKARLIATGERAPSWVAEGFGEYRKRLSHWLPLELVEVEPGLRGAPGDPEPPGHLQHADPRLPRQQHNDLPVQMIDRHSRSRGGHHVQKVRPLGRFT